MAKGNMLQGMARGKVGDVVFSRLNGQQISRVRNRQPYNPRTNKQLIQRSIMATVMLAYSAGQEIFNHSFQGKAVGAANQREFMRENAKALRAAIANDLNNNVALTSQKGRVVAPKAYAATPFECIISKGSYSQSFFTLKENNIGFGYPDATTDETCAHYCERNGLIPGDIYTFVGFTWPAALGYSTAEEALKNPVNADFCFIRLQVKDNALEDTAAINRNLATSTATSSVPFIITDKSPNVNVDTIEFDAMVELSVATLFEQFGGSLGVIRSRKDSDLRSDSKMYLKETPSNVSSLNGIASEYILDIWGAGATPVGDSDLILEGGDI